MRKNAKKFTTPTISSLPDGKYVDPQCPDLYLWVRSGGASRVWQMRYSFRGVARTISLGSVRSVTLAQARAKVAEYKNQIAAGIDPKLAPNTAPTANAVIFEADAAAFFEYARREWTEAHADIWRRSLERHVHPIIGKRPTADLTTPEIAALFYDASTQTGLWIEHTETAERVIDRVNSVIEYAIKTDDHGRFPNKVNPASSVKARLPRGVKPSPKAHRSLNWREAPALYGALSAREDAGAMALRLLMLACAPRAAEVIELKWTEVGTGADGQPALLIPGERMKGRKASRQGREIPLSGSAIDLLNSIRPVTLANPDSYVFKGRTGGPVREFRGCIGDEALRQVIDYVRFSNRTDVHGLRSTVKDWALDNLCHPLDAFSIERALGHAIGNSVAERYRRTDLIEHRRVLAERWAAYLEGREYVVPALAAVA